MKNTIILLCLLGVTQCFSQLFVSANSYLYVKEQVVFVKEAVNLSAATSHLYLRSNAQLVQGTLGVSSNSGLGVLSVFQEGTSDQFTYNYWCAPVGNATNGNFGLSLLNRPTSVENSQLATILPQTSYNGIANPLSIAPYFVNKLVNGGGYSSWINVGSPTATDIKPGEGFTMKGTSGTDDVFAGETIKNNPGKNQRYDFRGKPNDGLITIAVASGTEFLTGNPYPSALNLQAFLLDASNQAAGGTAYFWDQDPNTNSHYLANYRGGYGTYVPQTLGTNGLYTPPAFNAYNEDGTLNTGITSGTGIVYDRKYSPIGQGFVIRPTANGFISFKNQHRTYYKESDALSIFHKNAQQPFGDNNPVTSEEERQEEVSSEISHFRLNTIINNQFTRQVALTFIPEATDGVDFGIDGLNLDTELPSDVTFWLDDSSYVIQGVAFDASKKIDLTVKAASTSTFEFYIQERVNFDTSQSIYIYDSVDQSYHNITNSPYIISLPAGNYNNRFKIAFVDQNLNITNQEDKQFLIYQDNRNESLNISNPNMIQITSFKLYDVGGKTILSQNSIGGDFAYAFSTSSLSQGVYIAEFVTVANEKFTKKVIISNSNTK